MSHYDAVRMVKSVLENGGRSDRYLRMSDDGEYFTTPDRTFLTVDGRVTPTYIEIPVAWDCTEAEAEEWAEALIRELDDALAAEAE